MLLNLHQLIRHKVRWFDFTDEFNALDEVIDLKHFRNVVILRRYLQAEMLCQCKQKIAFVNIASLAGNVKIDLAVDGNYFPKQIGLGTITQD